MEILQKAKKKTKITGLIMSAKKQCINKKNKINVKSNDIQFREPF